MKHSDKRNFHLLATFVPRYLADHSNLIARIAHIIVGYCCPNPHRFLKGGFVILNMCKMGFL